MIRISILLLIFSGILFSNDPVFQEIQKIKASDRGAADRFGNAVAIDGDYAIVGAFENDEILFDEGAAYILELDEETGTWEEIQKLNASVLSFDNLFGHSVAIDGNYAIIGEPQGSDIGIAYIFELDEASGTWTEVQRLFPPDLVNGDNFGWSVAIDGDYAIISAPRKDEIIDEQASANNQGGDENTEEITIPEVGAVYIFERNSVSGQWEQVRKILASDGEAADRFGEAVAIDGDYAIVGARLEDHDVNGASQLNQAGSAYILKRNEVSGQWEEAQKIVASDRSSGDGFGWSVAIDGDYTVIGAYQDSQDENSQNIEVSAGSAFIFKRNSGTDQWEQMQKIVASDRGSGDWFGHSVSISGNRIAVGAPLEDHNLQDQDFLDVA